MSAATTTSCCSGGIPSNLCDIKVKDLDGKEHKLEEYKGKVKIISNVASLCTTTKMNYEGFVELYDKYHKDGLEILGFPCSQFGNEEYGNAEEIKTKCLQKYGVKFPIFELVNVNGENTHPVFLYCKWNSEELFNSAKISELYHGGKLADIEWNFGKFLLDKNDCVYKYYGSKTDPREMAADIEKLLKCEASGKRRGKDEKLVDCSC